jgi:hypothetical protein
MCFKSKDKTKYIAKEDIVCYKKVYIMPTSECMSYWTHFRYEFGKLYELKNTKACNVDYMYGHDPDNISLQNIIPVQDTGHLIWIDKGFHSYNIHSIDGFNVPNVKCIIPAGSEYYMNTSEYVSNQIIILEKL